MVQKVPVGKDGLFALVDDQDYALVSQYYWCAHRGYALHFLSDNGTTKSVRMHRLILGLGPGDPDVDHVNHAKMDNRRRNLRLATPSQNSANSHKRLGTTSQYKGVTWLRQRQRWYGQIRVQAKLISLGYFASEIDAARAYDSASAHFHGEFAVLNFPDATPAPYAPRRKPTNVSYCPTQRGSRKWVARVQRNGQRHQLGYFPTEQEAIAAVQTYKQKHGP